MDNTNIKVISFEDLKKIKNGEIVPIEGFNGEGYVNVRLIRPSLLDLAAKGEIPNPLLSTAYKLFYGDKSDNDKDKKTSIADDGKIYNIIAEKALVQPTYKEIEEAGVMLNDAQLLQIWQYVQLGAKALDSFRKIYWNTENTENKQEVQTETK